MKVTLLNYTSEPDKMIAAAARLCYSNVQDVDTLMNGLTVDKIDSFIDKMSELKNHGTPWEHPSFTFAIEGVSRVLTHQLVRHRIASFDQQSQRYCEGKNFTFVIPPSIAKNPELLEKFENFMQESQDMYKEFIEAGIPKEDARFLFTNACSTRIIMTMNVRSLFHFFALRSCCYDEQTEVLTSQGWKFFKDLTGDEKFYSMDPDTFNVQLVNANHLIQDKYDGPMVNVKSQSIDLLVTPNHKNFVSYSYENKKFILDDASEYDNHKTILMKKNCLPISGIITDKYIIPEVMVEDKNQYSTWYKTINSKTVSIEDMMQFVGMYISDGYCYKSGYHYNVGICKGSYSKIVKYYDILCRLSDNTPVISEDKRPKNVVWKLQVHDRRLYEFFSKIGKTLDKHIPEEFFQYDHSILSHLFNGLCDGDMNSSETIYSTSSVQLKDDIQRLCLHLGFSGTATCIDRRGSVSTIENSDGITKQIVTKNLNYQVSINRSKNEPIIKRNGVRDAFNVIKYTGNIYCAELEKYHLLYVRRNGYTVWSGNSRAQWEIRELSNQILHICKTIAPKVFQNAGASCVQLGYCPEGHMSCGRAPTLEELLTVYKDRT